MSSWCKEQQICIVYFTSSTILKRIYVDRAKVTIFPFHLRVVEKDEGRGQSVDAGSREERWPQQEVPPWRGCPVDAGSECQRCQADSECMPKMSSCRKEEKSCL